jgi:hypothetical protein
VNRRDVGRVEILKPRPDFIEDKGFISLTSKEIDLLCLIIYCKTV